ncbi:MAG TPA: TonB-dependent receptor [Ohtaekwangia sp.]
MMKLYRFLKMVFVIVCCVASSQVLAQSVKITGKVTSGDDGTALPGVSVVEKGTTNGTVTDADGNYTVNVKSDATLVFSFVGYSTQEVAVAGKTTADVTLLADVTALSEIVVIGYGEVQKKDATGAVMNMSNKDFNKGVLTNPQDLIVGKFAGVTVTSASGAPGANTTIRIRDGASLSATNDPLIVIDGFPVEKDGPGGISNPLSSLNPNDIETYTVLKDASATAIYGSRASNGVIIITTKKGAQGKPKFNYNGTVSVSSPIKFVDVLNGDEYRDLVAELDEAGTFGIDQAGLDKLGTANTDWQEEIYQTAISQDHNLNVEGSVKDIPYRVSYGYTNQEGILKNTDLQRNSLNIMLTPSFLDGDLKITASAKGAYIDSNFGETGAVGNAVGYDPTQVVRDEEDGSLNAYGGYFNWLKHNVVNGNDNPVAQVEQTDNRGTNKRIIGTIQAEYRLPFLKELKAVVNAGFDRSSSEGHNRVPVAGWVHSTNVLTGKFNSYTGINQSDLIDLYVNYNKQIGKSKIDAIAGYGYQYFFRKKTNIDSSTVSVRKPLPDKSDNVLISFFGRVNYTYNDKYLLTASLRNDLTSRFSKDNRSGFFPAVALGWKIKEEDFMSSVTALSDLKLRVSWGITGQQGLEASEGATSVSNPYTPYIPVYQSSDLLTQYQLGGTFYTTVRPEPYDPSIKWEETTTINIGVDFGLFDDKITGSIEVFQKDTEDLINNIQIANGSNFSNFLATNIGSMKNQGIEVTLNALAISREDFTWRIGANFTSINSEITKLSLNDLDYPGVPRGSIGVGAYIQNLQVGQPAFSFYPLQQVYDANGKPIEGLYVDRSGDGGDVASNFDNRYYHHRPAADFTMGLNTRLEYKKFDFSFSGRLSVGNYVYNNVMSGNAWLGNVYSNQHWRNVPTAVRETGFVNQQRYSDYYIENASFFKMDNISAGYNFDQVLTEKLKARVSLTVQNAFTVTDYSGLDPEVDGGIDNNIYPRPRTFLLGVNLTF